MKKGKVCRVLLTVFLWLLTVAVLVVGLYLSAKGTVSWPFLALAVVMGFISAAASMHMDTKFNKEKDD